MTLAETVAFAKSVAEKKAFMGKLKKDFAATAASEKAAA